VQFLYRRFETTVGFLPYILLVLLPGLALTLWAAWRVRSTYAKWDKVDSGINMNAFDFARYLLNAQGLTDVGVEPTPGNLTDHYDPRSKTLRVSQGVSGSRVRGSFNPLEQQLGYTDYSRGLSVAAAAVIAHEVGHAAQHRQGDPAMALRQLVVPVAQIGSTLAPWLVIIGVFMNFLGLAYVGLAFFAGAVAFTFVTLPVEFGASNRALAYVTPLGLQGERADGARSVLRAAGWTYVAAALTALLTFLYYLWLVMGSRR
jgi:Zn-dependent membrane protease YugP